MEEIEDKIIDLLNQADYSLSSEDFDKLAESLINYIDDISRSKK